MKKFILMLFLSSGLLQGVTGQITFLQSFNSWGVAVVNFEGMGTYVLHQQGTECYLFDLKQTLVEIFTRPLWWNVKCFSNSFYLK